MPTPCLLCLHERKGLNLAVPCRLFAYSLPTLGRGTYLLLNHHASTVYRVEQDFILNTQNFLVYIFHSIGTTTADIARETYQNGNNPSWKLEFSSESRRFPPNKALKRSGRRRAGKFASFAVGDKNTSFSIWFRGAGKFLLHSLTVHLTTKIKYYNTSVTIKILNENETIDTKVSLSCILLVV